MSFSSGKVEGKGNLDITQFNSFIDGKEANNAAEANAVLAGGANAAGLTLRRVLIQPSWENGEGEVHDDNPPGCEDDGNKGIDQGKKLLPMKASILVELSNVAARAFVRIPIGVVIEGNVFDYQQRTKR